MRTREIQRVVGSAGSPETVRWLTEELGFDAAFDYREAASEFYRAAGGWLAEGRLVSRETYVDGLDRCVEAFLGLGSGGNTGKMLVRL